MPVTHDPWLVALSLVVAIQGAYVGLSLAVQVAAASGLRRRLLLAGAAISLAVAIWAMHFVGMLAARLPIPVDYLVFPTLLSFLVCVLVVGAAIFAASAGPPTAWRLAASACFMGGGITAMHYIGMTALHASAALHHAPWLVAASVAIAIATSGLALWLASGRRGRPPLLLSAVALGSAITGMHYTAMAGLMLMPHAGSTGAPALSSDLLAIVVAIVAFVVSGIFLLTLVPEPRGAAAPQAAPPDVQPADAQPPAAAPAEAPRAATRQDDPAPAHGSVAPIAGSPAGGAPRRPARQLPVEKDGITHFVAVDDIVAVHANAHYTYVYDGATKWFCPLAIGDVEQRLDSSRFVRVHRSHIVNIDRVVGLRRSGDNGLVELAGGEHYAVPVSRSRVTWLKARIGSKVGAVAS